MVTFAAYLLWPFAATAVLWLLVCGLFLLIVFHLRTPRARHTAWGIALFYLAGFTLVYLGQVVGSAIVGDPLRADELQGYFAYDLLFWPLI